MSQMEKVSTATFQQVVLESTKPTLVDFTAVWCGPCKMLDPVVEQIAEEWDTHMQFVKLDVDENPELAMQFQVMGVPTLMLFVDGNPVERVTGYKPKDRLMKQFSQYLPVA